MSLISEALADVLSQNAARVCLAPDGTPSTGAAAPAALLPGSFNPLHEGHLRLAAVAARLLATAVDFELSLTNVDKPEVDRPDLCRRALQFRGQGRLWITRAPTFAEKSLLFPATVFIIGCDTAERLIDPRYYGNGAARMQAAFECIRAQGCRFLVAGRQNQAGVFRECDDLSFPAALAELFQGIPRSQFELALSSTLLRRR